MQEVESTQGFDLRTYIRDPKSGQVIKRQPYRLHHCAEHGEWFERPVNSGNCWFRNGQPAGRITYKTNDKGARSKVWEPEAQHVAWTPPTPEDPRAVIAEKDQRIADLEARLMSLESRHIEKEKSAKAEAVAKATAKETKKRTPKSADTSMDDLLD